MSIVVALARREAAYIVTDSQQTNLKTGETTFGHVKSQKISDGLIVGYAGHSDVCQTVVKLAKSVHTAAHNHNSNATDFIDSIDTAKRMLQLQYGNDVFDGLVHSYIIVGTQNNKTRIIKLYGSYTRFVPVNIDTQPNGIQIGFLPPDDMAYSECLKIYNLVKNTTHGQCSLPSIGKRIVQEISRRSRYCGGDPQILCL